MLSKHKDKALPIVSILAKPFLSVHPNVISLVGFLFSIVFALLLARGYYYLAIISFIGVLFDTLDGYVARESGKVSKFGGFFDSTLDRASDFIIINAFAFAGLVAWEITLTLTLFSFLVSYTRSRAELAGNGKFTLDVGIIERTERLVLIIGLLIIEVVFEVGFVWSHYNLIELGFMFLIVLSLITVVQRMIKAYEYLK